MPKVIDLPTATSMGASDYLLMELSGGGTRKITKSNALSNIGAMATSTLVTDTVTSGTRTTVRTLTVTPGIWVIMGSVRFNGALSTNTSMEAGIGLASGEMHWGNMAFSRVYVPTGLTSPSATTGAIYRITATSTIHLIAAQYSGTSASIDTGATFLRAVQIA